MLAVLLKKKKLLRILKTLGKKPRLEVKVHLILLFIYLYIFCSFLKRTKRSVINMVLLQSLAEVRTGHFSPVYFPLHSLGTLSRLRLAQPQGLGPSHPFSRGKCE